eukprot:scaffold41447_cov183-Amphora_coffeaeformis.AAC.1
MNCHNQGRTTCGRGSNKDCYGTRRHRTRSSSRSDRGNMACYFDSDFLDRVTTPTLVGEGMVPPFVTTSPKASVATYLSASRLFSHPLTSLAEWVLLPDAPADWPFRA